jgi:glycosyltransferase involved in cell wall biosynthesis
VAALQRAALELLLDPQRRRELGEAGRDFVRREHSWDRAGARLLEVYNSLRAAL